MPATLLRGRGKRPVGEVQTFGGGVDEDNINGGAGLQVGSPVSKTSACVELWNGHLNPDGTLEIRQGERQLAAAFGVGVDCKTGFYWEANNQHVAFREGVGNLLFRYWTGETAPIAPTTIFSGGTAASTYQFCVGFRDVAGPAMYFSSNNLGKFDGAACSAVGGAIFGATLKAPLAVYNQRMFGVGGSSNQLLYSDLNNGDTLGDSAAGGGLAYITTSSNQKITGLIPVGGSLFIMHQNAISRFTGWSMDDIQIDSGTSGMSTTVGTLWPESCVALGHEGYFLSQDGFYRLTENGIQLISANIDTSALATATDVIGVYFKPRREIWWFSKSETTIKAYIYNLDLGVWYRYRSATPGVTTKWVWSSPSAIMVLGSDNVVRRLDYPGMGYDNVAVDGSTGDQFSLDFTKTFYCGDYSAMKSLRYGYFYGAELPIAGAFVLTFTGDIDNVPVTSTPTYDTNGRSARVQLGTNGRSFKCTGSFYYPGITGQTPFLLSSVAAEGIAYAKRF